MNAIQPVDHFVDKATQMAKKYKAKVSISVPGEKEVVIADHRDEVIHSDNLAPVEDANATQVLLDLENLTKTNVDNIAKITAEIKKLTEMLDSALMNDESYRDIKEQVKKLNKERLTKRFQIFEVSSNKALAEKLRAMKEEKKELTGAQSDYLREYHRMSGSNQLELFDGQLMEIMYTCKLIKAR